MDLNFVSNKLRDLKRTINKAIYGSWQIVDYVTKDDICSYDTFFGFEYISSCQLPTYKIQNGSFRNYNKINNPDLTHVSIGVSGNRKILKKAIDLLDVYNKGTDLVDVITPFKTFVGYNLCNMNYRIVSGDTISRLTIEFDVYEIRQSSIIFNDVDNPNYKGNVKNGKVQPKNITSTSLLKTITNKITGGN